MTSSSSDGSEAVINVREFSSRLLRKSHLRRNFSNSLNEEGASLKDWEDIVDEVITYFTEPSIPDRMVIKQRS